METGTVTVCVVINTFNEGPDVEKTVESFRKNAGHDVVPVFVVVSDGTTDGSCDCFADRDDVHVLQTEDDSRYGCGQAKHVGVKYAREVFKPDVILHSDGHNRLVKGTLADIAQVCINHSPSVITPALGPLNCIKGEKCEFHAGKKCTQSCKDIEDNIDVPPNAYHGGKIGIERKDHREVGLFVDNTIRPPTEPIGITQAVNPSCFAYTPETLDAIGGWNRYPGQWGSQELGISSRCFFSCVPIRILRSDFVCVLHRYRSWNHPEGKAIAPYSIPADDRDVNWRYAHRVVFSDDTWKRLWKPWFDRHNHNPKADAVLEDSHVQEQREAFLKIKQEAAKTDRDFFREMLEIDFPLDVHVKEGRNRALYCIGAGLGNALMCVPAIKALAEISGQPVDLWDRGLHQGEQVRELFQLQPWIRKVIQKPPEDMSYYKYVVGSVWAKGPMFVAVNAEVGQASKGGWRTRHEVEANLDAMAQAWVGQQEWKALAPSAMISAWQRIDTKEKDYVAIGTGCAGFKSKMYPHWKRVAEILNEYGVNIVFVGAASDDEPWMDELGENFCGRTTVAQAGGLLELSRLYVGLDNGLSHLAAAVGRRSLLLYGPSSERKNLPWTADVRVLRSGEHACAPCWDKPNARKCNFKAENRRPCMEAIRPEYVAGEILKELNAPAWISAETWPLYLTRKQKIENMGAVSLQNHEEFAGLIDMLRSQPIRNVCEIGNADGFWLGVLATAIGRPLNILAIDPDPNSFPHPEACPENYPRKMGDVTSLLTNQGHYVFRCGHKSQSEEAQTKISEFVSDHGPLDVLHIDGDHSEEGCLADWDFYSGYVRPGGFIILHDVYNDTEPGVQKVWEMAKKSGQVWKALKICQEKATPKTRGIGVIQKWLTDSTA